MADCVQNLDILPILSKILDIFQKISQIQKYAPQILR